MTETIPLMTVLFLLVKHPEFSNGVNGDLCLRKNVSSASPKNQEDKLVQESRH